MKKLLIVLMTLTSLSTLACDYNEAVAKLKKKLTYQHVDQDKMMSLSSKLIEFESFDLSDGSLEFLVVKERSLKVYMNHFVVLSETIYRMKQKITLNDSCHMDFEKAELIDIRNVSPI